MKKTYISPQTQVEEMATELIFCASEGVQGTSLPGDKASDQYETLSRGFNLWDDDEEDDYEK
jgi:hypothetical protein